MYRKPQFKGGGPLVSRHGPHLAVGVGSVRSKVLVGGMRGPVPVTLQIYLVVSFVVVAFEGSGHYAEAAAVTVVAVLVGLCRWRSGPNSVRSSL